ncbi:MAG: site-specific integrase [Paludibacteraceae bacterium]|nr:site-specific integrase [Paludibacteraceae bacterium]
MATITIEIGKKNKKRLHPVSFLICEGRTKKRIPTGITATDSELTTNGKRIREPEKAKMIEQKRRELQERLDVLQLDTIGQTMDAQVIVTQLTQDRQVLDFFTFADDWLSKSDIKGAKNYRTMLNSLEGYLGERRLPFKTITYKLLEDYGQYLKEKPRAASLYLGQMRHLFREAMRRYNTDYDTVIQNDPFLRFRVPRQPMKKGVRALTLEQLLAIYRYKGKAHSRPQLARDCFILSFCLMGMNSVDMYEARTMTGGVIKYNRIKTRDRRQDDAYIEVRIHPVIAQLIKRYRGNSRVFSFHERYRDESTFNKALNLGLKTVGEAVGIDGLQFYQARHTFATLSRNLMHFSKGDVDEALNHVGSYDVADIYIQKDFSVINDNNFKLLDKVFG